MMCRQETRPRRHRSRRSSTASAIRNGHGAQRRTNRSGSDGSDESENRALRKRVKKRRRGDERECECDSVVRNAVGIRKRQRTAKKGGSKSRVSKTSLELRQKKPSEMEKTLNTTENAVEAPFSLPAPCLVLFVFVYVYDSACVS